MFCKIIGYPLLVIIQILFHISISFADEYLAPEWVTKMPDDDRYFYGVGIGYGTNEADAAKAADNDAIVKIFETAFGLRVSTTKLVTSDNIESKINVKSEIDLDMEFLDQVQRAGLKIQKADKGQFVGYELVRVEKSIVQKNKKSDQSENKNLNSAHLLLTSNPDEAQVFIDEIKVGVTPLNISLLTKKYKIKVVKSGYEDFVKELTLRRKEKISIDADLVPLNGKIELSCNTQGAQFEIDGELFSGSKKWTKDLPVGTHKLKVFADGFETWEKELNLDENESKFLKINLKRQINSSSRSSNKLSLDDQVSELIKEDKWAELIELARKNRKTNEWGYLTLFYEGLGLFKMGQLDDSAEIFNKAIKVINTAEAHGFLCEIHLAKKEETSAKKECSKALKIDPKNSYSLIVQARIYREKFLNYYVKYYANSIQASEFANEMIAYYKIASPYVDFAMSELADSCSYNRYKYGECYRYGSK